MIMMMIVDDIGEHIFPEKSGARRYSGRWSTLIQYNLCTLFTQHRMGVCRITLVMRKMRRAREEKRNRWWKFKKRNSAMWSLRN